MVAFMVAFMVAETLRSLDPWLLRPENPAQGLPPKLRSQRYLNGSLGERLVFRFLEINSAPIN